MLLRLWVLNKYHKKIDVSDNADIIANIDSFENINIPEITVDTISMAMNSVMKPCVRGPKPKGNNLLLFNEFKSLYNFELEDGKHLSAVLAYYETTMLTSITNNIKMNFFSYMNRYINSYFTKVYEEQMNNKEFKKQLFKDLRIIKNDILNNTLLCDVKYHKWINENKI